jgi:hypothetical protein
MSSPQKLLRHNTKSERQSSKRRYSFRLSKSLSDQFQDFCNLHPHINPQSLINHLVLLGLGQAMPSMRVKPVSKTASAHDFHQHVTLLSEPFAEFHGLVFKKHRAIDRAFSPDQSEIKKQTNTYVLDVLDELGS